MFVVAPVPVDGGMGSRYPAAAHGAHSGILAENFHQSVGKLAAQCSNVVFGAGVFGIHGLPPTLTWNGPAIGPIAIAATGSQNRSVRIKNITPSRRPDCIRPRHQTPKCE